MQYATELTVLSLWKVDNVACMSGREAALWEVEERHLLELGAEKKQHIQQSYDLRRRQLAFRRSQVSCIMFMTCSDYLHKVSNNLE